MLPLHSNGHQILQWLKPIKFAFAPSPTLVASADTMDFSTADGKAIHNTAIKSSCSDSKFHHAGSGATPSNFLCILSEQEDSFGWNDNGTLGTDLNCGNLQLPVLSNLLENCGTVSMKQCQRHVETHVDTQTGAAQDDGVLHSCPLASISMEFVNEIKNKRVKSTVRGTESGVMTPWVMVSEACRDTNASLKHLDNQVRQPPECMIAVKDNVSKLNSHVNSIAEEMNARSHTNSEPLLTLFAAHKNVPTLH